MRRLVPFLALLLAVPSAAAHAYIVQSDPASGQRLDALPDAVHLSYTEGIQRGEAHVLDGRRQRIDTGAFQVDSSDDKNVAVPLAQGGGEGVYVLQWKVLSVDTHVTSGSLYFTVGNATPTRQAILESASLDGAHPGIALTPALAKAALLASLAVLLGAPVTTGLARRALQQPPGWGAARLRRILLVSGAVGLAAAFALALPSLVGIAGTSPNALLGAVLGTQTGQLLLLHAALLGGVLALLASPRPLAWGIRFAPAAALVCQVGISRLSHSGSFVSQSLGLATDLAHLAGSGLWFGGLVALLLVALPGLRDLAQPGAGATLVRWFSILALAGLTLTASAGLLMASWFVPEPSHAASTPYGLAAAAKVVLLLFALALAAVNRFWWVRSLDTPRRLRNFQQTVAAETVLLGIVLVLSGLMTTIPTAVAAGHEADTSFQQTADLSGGQGKLRIVPAMVGFNAIDVRLFRDGGAWQVPGNLTLLLRSSTGIELPAVPLVPQGDGLYSAVAAIPFPANWTLRYSFFIPGAGFYATSTHLVLEPAAHHHHGAGATVSQGSLRSPLAAAAGAVALVGALAVAGEAMVFRRAPR